MTLQQPFFRSYRHAGTTCLICFGILFSVARLATGSQPGDSEANGTQAATAAMAAFRLPEGFTAELFAANPKLTNPIAFCLDEQGRVYVAEDHRFLEGTPENRSHSFLLDDDLQVNTLADRLAMQTKWADRFDKGSAWFTQTSDIVRQLVDSDGDGKADQSNVFADGFDGPLDGLGSGVIARDGKVWFTCIPSLWLLSDNDNDGRADSRTALLDGFGVNAGFYGHDLHGLVWGVDGKLYFSVGDRGAHVVTKEGTTISNPRRGAVYRCNPDGTELERIHQGLRNPQELAIDQYGNLFADDNNCDKGDDSRLVYIVPGGDSGWNMAYQHIPEPYLTGPWHAEGIWHLAHDLQPAYVVPPVGKIGAGPSGFVFSSGTSLPPRYQNHFFYCNFTGNGGVESFAVQPQGAGFTIIDHHDFCKPVMASDVDFGYDGKMYLSDYPTNPFDRTTSGGRIYTVFDKARLDQPIVVETRRLFQEGFEHRNAKELVSFLYHDDMRVRLRAQFALAARGNEAAGDLTTIAIGDDNQLTRLHAIWGLGQIGRSRPEVLSPVLALLTDKDSEVRAQAARVLGDARYEPSASHLVQLLGDDSERVRFFAALALGSLQHTNAVESIVAMLRDNDGRDRQLAHAGVLALELISNRELVQRYAGDASAAVRMAVLLVQRRWADSHIAQFLDDAELKIVTEAARAINDLPLPAGREKLANLAERYRNASGDEVVPLLRRIVNANLQLGGRANVEAVIAIATSDLQPLVIRREAIAALAAWQGPTTRDRVTGFWQPIEAREVTTVRDAVQQAAARLLAASPDALQADVTGLLVTLKVDTDDRVFASWVVDVNRSPAVRMAALRLLNSRQFEELPQIIDALLASDSTELRAEARDLLADNDADRATSLISQLLDDQHADISEKQRAFATLARMKSPSAGQLLDAWAVRLRERQVPLSLQLDLIDALAASPTESRQVAINEFKASGDSSDSLAVWQVAMAGGNAARGRDVFVGHAVAQCIRCHTVGGRGGTAGPDLSAVASPERHQDRRSLLESIVAPNAKIAKGFGTVTLVLDTGKLVAGTIKDEDETSLTLVTPLNETIRIDRNTIDEQSVTTSAMPAMTKTLTLREIRDLVEYLSTLKTMRGVDSACDPVATTIGGTEPLAAQETDLKIGAKPLSLTHPQPHQVLQRIGIAPGKGSADVLLIGKLPDHAHKATWEYRIEVLADQPANQASAVAGCEWTRFTPTVVGETFQGSVCVPAGGWYRVGCRCRVDDNVLAASKVEPIGVGEVFVVAGQSYATNCNDEQLTVADPMQRVVAFNSAKQSWAVGNDPQPVFDGSDGGSIWPPLGDALAKEFEVPIGFANVAIGGSSSAQWLPDGDMIPRLISVGKTLGTFRAVLWQQGESDVLAKNSTEGYVANISRIRETAAKAWGTSPPWLLAKSTHHPTVYNDPEGEGRIRAGIDELIKHPAFLPGPDTDTLTGENRGDINSRRHFTGIGQRRAADLWLASIRQELLTVKDEVGAM